MQAKNLTTNNLPHSVPFIFRGDEMATLAEVNAAITKVADEGQSSMIDGISYTRANLVIPHPVTRHHDKRRGPFRRLPPYFPRLQLYKHGV